MNLSTLKVLTLFIFVYLSLPGWDSICLLDRHGKLVNRTQMHALLLLNSSQLLFLAFLYVKCLVLSKQVILLTVQNKATVINDLSVSRK